MGNSCRWVSSAADFQASNFYNKNRYNSEPCPDKHKIVLEKIAPYSQDPQLVQIATYIANQHHMQFQDPNFAQLQHIDHDEKTSLDKLYNFTRLKLEYVYEVQNSLLDVFEQKQLPMCYLTVVFYLICRSPQLKDSIFLTRTVNPHNAYILRLFCNGEPCHVVVDSHLPTRKSSIKYLSVVHPQEIWPFLLEKAWCKQIGAYDKAVGLSPEDCFEEITGIPAQSFSIDYMPIGDLKARLSIAKEAGKWVTLTAHETGADVLPRQVFHLERITADVYTVRSPYTDFNKAGSRSAKGAITLRIQQLKTYFQFVTIGHYLPNHRPISQPFTSVAHEQVIFQLQILQSNPINIRVVQFYEQYLQPNEKEYYSYSPVHMELYDSQCRLVEGCEGRAENMQGIRSSSVSTGPMVVLAPGKYCLRVQVAWVFPSLYNKANLAVYASNGSVSIKKYIDENLSMYAKFLAMTLQSPRSNQLQNPGQQVKIRHIEKAHGYVLGVQNISAQPASLKIQFNGNQNIRINHYKLENNSIQVKLQGMQEKVFEILAQDTTKPFILAPFDIIKL